MRRTIIAVLIAALAAMSLTGCVTPMAVSKDALGTLQGQPLTVVTYNPKVGFIQMTVGTAAFGAIGALAAIQMGSDLTKAYNLQSPALRVADQMKPVLQDRLNPSAMTPLADPSEGGLGTNELAARAGNKGLVFDVDIGWQAGYFPFDWLHYRVMINGRARLVDASTGKLLALAVCKNWPDDSKGAPTYDELYADNAAVLKAKFQDEADDCAMQMTKALFGG